MALDHRDMLDLLAPFAERWRIILWDMPGHGGSGAVPEPCTLGAMTDALEGVLDDAAVVDPVLVGFSFGGMVAQDLLFRGTHALRGLVAFGCFAPFLVEAPLPQALVESLLIEPILAGAWSDVRSAFATACSLDPAIRTRLAEPIDRLGPEGLVAMTRALFGAFAPNRGFRLEIPTLVLRGADDANGAALSLSAAALLDEGDDVREVIIADAGHCAHLDQPERTGAAVADFLQTVRLVHPA